MAFISAPSALTLFKNGAVFIQENVSWACLRSFLMTSCFKFSHSHTITATVCETGDCTVKLGGQCLARWHIGGGGVY